MDNRERDRVYAEAMAERDELMRECAKRKAEREAERKAKR